MTGYVLIMLIITVIIVCAFLFVKRARNSNRFNFDNAPVSTYDFSSLNIQQIIDLLGNQVEEGNNITVGVWTGIMKRLIDITYFEYDVSIEDRQIGMKFIPVIIADIEKSLEPHPDYLEQFRQVYKSHMSSAKTRGYGSLGWKLHAPGVDKAEFFKIIIDPSSGPLIPDYLVVLQRNKAQFIPAVLSVLIRDRRRLGEYNAVLILSGLVSGYDLVAWNLLTESDREALLNVSRNYYPAREVLVKYDLLPKDSVAAPLASSIEIEFLHIMVVLDTTFPKTFPEDTNIKAEYDSLNEDHKTTVTLIVMVLRQKLWLDLIQEVYGEKIKEDVERRLAATIIEEHKEIELKSFMEKLSLVDNYRSQGSYHGPDLGLAAYFTDGCYPEGTSDDEILKTVKTIANIINFARVGALHEFRLKLRFFAKYPPDGGLPAPDREVLRKHLEETEELMYSLYSLFGSEVPNLEQKLLAEDWIGYMKFGDPRV